MKIIGIDTSCYTTSVCVVDENEKLLGDYRKVLNVKQGNRGLRQSEAVFQHMNNLPDLISELFSGIERKDISAVTVSSVPRRVEDSYMPVFMVSLNIGKILSLSLGVPLLKYSHQEGHIRAGIWSADGPKNEKFLAVHLSGGTTEILKVKRENNGFSIDIIGKTLDISAGQLVDRVGVALGLGFPCGKKLEELALAGTDNIKVPVWVKEENMSFSGSETFLQKYINDSKSEDVAFAVQVCIAKTLEKVIVNAVKKYNLSEVLMVGGVSSNQYIKNYLLGKLGEYRLYFSDPAYSVDNSVGTALLGVDYAKADFNRK